MQIGHHKEFSLSFIIHSYKGLTFKTLYGGQVKLSTELIKPKYLTLDQNINPNFNIVLFHQITVCKIE